MSTDSHFNSYNLETSYTNTYLTPDKKLQKSLAPRQPASARLSYWNTLAMNTVNGMLKNSRSKINPLGIQYHMIQIKRLGRIHTADCWWTFSRYWQNAFENSKNRGKKGREQHRLEGVTSSLTDIRVGSITYKWNGFHAHFRERKREW